MSHSHFYGAPVHTKLNFLSPVNLSYADFIIRPAEEPKREDGKLTSPSEHMAESDAEQQAPRTAQASLR